jgi:hypothetical protein
MTQSSLFPETTEMQQTRVDQQILHLLMGGSGGTLNLPLDDDEKDVLRRIRYHRGLAHAISLATISGDTQLNARAIKQAVRTLRLNYRLPIGSSKNANGGGYYLMFSDEDRRIWRNDVIDQVRAQLEVLHAADGRQAALEALGQLRVELEKEIAHA